MDFARRLDEFLASTPADTLVDAENTTEEYRRASLQYGAITLLLRRMLLTTGANPLSLVTDISAEISGIVAYGKMRESADAEEAALAGKTVTHPDGGRA